MILQFGKQVIRGSKSSDHKDSLYAKLWVMQNPSSLERTLIFVVFLVCSSMALMMFFMAGSKNCAMSVLNATKFTVVHRADAERLPIEFDTARSNIVYRIILISTKRYKVWPRRPPEAGFRHSVEMPGHDFYVSLCSKRWWTKLL